MRVSVSRILSWRGIYLGALLPARSSGTLSTTFANGLFLPSAKVVLSTALHSSKDFAVSLSVFPQRLTPKGFELISQLNVTVRTSRITPDGRYPLPFTEHHFCKWYFLPSAKVVLRSVRTFLAVQRTAHLSDTRWNDNCINDVCQWLKDKPTLKPLYRIISLRNNLTFCTSSDTLVRHFENWITANQPVNSRSKSMCKHYVFSFVPFNNKCAAFYATTLYCRVWS